MGTMSQRYQGSRKAEGSDERLCLSKVDGVTSLNGPAAGAGAGSRGELDLDHLPGHTWGPFQ